MTAPSFLLAFTAGVLSFLSPCVLPLVPFYLSYVSGSSVGALKELEEKKKEKGTWPMRLRILRGALGFVLGFSVVTILILGALAGAFAEGMQRHQESIRLAAGLVVIVLGIHLTGLINLRLLRREKHLEAGSTRRDGGVLGSVLLGFSFGAGWSPCIGPIIGGVLALAGTSGEFWRGFHLMIVYTAGLAVPFLLSALLVTRFFSFFDHLKRHLRWIERLSGALLIVMGILIATDTLSRLNLYLIQTFPFLADLS